MFFKDLVMKVKESNVREKMLELYPDPKFTKNIEGYMNALQELKTLEPQPDSHGVNDLFITISWADPDEDFDEEGYYRVSGVEPGNSQPWGIEYSRWEYWLGWKVDPKSLEDHGEVGFICHCLWEMTWAGYTNEDVIKFNEEFDNRVKKIDEGTATYVFSDDVDKNLI